MSYVTCKEKHLCFCLKKYSIILNTGCLVQCPDAKNKENKLLFCCISFMWKAVFVFSLTKRYKYSKCEGSSMCLRKIHQGSWDRIVGISQSGMKGCG